MHPHKNTLDSVNMKKRRIFIFTMSNWVEQPRLRHQVAKLLSDAGEDVHFFQGSRYIWKKPKSNEDFIAQSNLHVHRALNAIHPQLRVNSIFRFVNNFIEIISIKKIIGGHVNDEDVVINFNYDFYFLRQLFLKNKIITIINDDFVAQAKFLRGRHVRLSLKKTCAISDSVLAVSYPLVNQLKNWSRPELFLPWADVQYIAPFSDAPKRNSVLLWAYIDVRIDFDLLRAAASALPETEFHVYGDRYFKIEPEVEKSSAAPNIMFKSSAQLSDIDINRYYAAIIPYKKNSSDIEAVTLSNKSFQLLARGIPLVVSGMPNFLSHASIKKTNTTDAFLEALKQCKIEFWKLQPLIEILVNENQRQNRFEQLRRIMG